MFKVAYAYGRRFNELRHLQTVDFSRNAHAGQFGRYGVVQVRYGKAKNGSPPKRRGVLTVFTWTAEVITDWLAHGQACMGAGLDLFPSERGALVAENTLLRRFRRYCRDLELPDGLDLHSLRRSNATHLIEDGRATRGCLWFGRCRRCGFDRWSQPNWRAGSVRRERAFPVGRCRR
jgi:integrase/recombinase XerD